MPLHLGMSVGSEVRAAMTKVRMRVSAEARMQRPRDSVRSGGLSVRRG